MSSISASNNGQPLTKEQIAAFLEQVENQQGSVVSQLVAEALLEDLGLL